MAVIDRRLLEVTVEINWPPTLDGMACICVRRVGLGRKLQTWKVSHGDHAKRDYLCRIFRLVTVSLSVRRAKVRLDLLHADISNRASRYRHFELVSLPCVPHVKTAP